MRAAPQALAGLMVGPGDDCAVLADGTALTVDTMVEGVHFDERISPEDLGYKAVTVSVSDLAATGATPTWLLLALSAPRTVDATWFEAIARGVGDACRTWGIALIGGDTTRSSGPVVLSTTAAGRCAGAPLLRSGARASDDLWVTGTPGLAALGYLAAAPSERALRALHHPAPPVAFALALAAAGLATAAMDLSDGLRSDLPRLCAASRLGAQVDSSALPALQGPAELLATAQLAGGDDFELLFTAPAAARDAILALALTHAVRATRIGAMHATPGAQLSSGPWPAPGFAHFTRVSA